MKFYIIYNCPLLNTDIPLPPDHAPTGWRSHEGGGGPLIYESGLEGYAPLHPPTPPPHPPVAPHFLC